MTISATIPAWLTEQQANLLSDDQVAQLETLRSALLAEGNSEDWVSGVVTKFAADYADDNEVQSAYAGLPVPTWAAGLRCDGWTVDRDEVARRDWALVKLPEVSEPGRNGAAMREGASVQVIGAQDQDGGTEVYVMLFAEGDPRLSPVNARRLGEQLIQAAEQASTFGSQQ